MPRCARVGAQGGLLTCKEKNEARVVGPSVSVSTGGGSRGTCLVQLASAQKGAGDKVTSGYLVACTVPTCLLTGGFFWPWGGVLAAGWLAEDDAGKCPVPVPG